jgi:hypothetical protein
VDGSNPRGTSFHQTSILNNGKDPYKTIHHHLDERERKKTDIDFHIFDDGPT